MNKKITEKYIDLNQFPKNEKGNISWKNSIGITAEFFYYNEKHIIKILNYGNPNIDSVEIKVDDMPPMVVSTRKVKHLCFDQLFYKPNYFYNVGDIVNNVIILEQLYIEFNSGNKSGKGKHYRCKCLKDGYEYIISENDLKKCKGFFLPDININIFTFGCGNFSASLQSVVYLVCKNCTNINRGDVEFIIQLYSVFETCILKCCLTDFAVNDRINNLVTAVAIL